jgi:hypothetical protein
MGDPTVSRNEEDGAQEAAQAWIERGHHETTGHSVWCRERQRQLDCDPAEMARRYGADTPISRSFSAAAFPGPR